MSPTATEGKTSRSYLGCGCAGIVFVVMSVMLGVVLLGYLQSQRLKAGAESPEVRRRQVDGILHVERLPEGYYPLGGLRIPWLFQTAILTDEPPQEAGAARPKPSEKAGHPFRQRGFVYMSLLKLRRNDAAIQDYFTGKSGAREGAERLMPQSDVEFSPQEVVGRGTVVLQDGEALYVARRGTLAVGGEKRPGLATLLYFLCPDDARLRLGLWFGPDPDPGKPTSDTDWKGTPADPEAIESFLGHFRVCG